MPRKREAPTFEEQQGYLVQCPTCHVAKNHDCVVVRPLDPDRIGARADQMHRPRVLMGRKWAEWHRGINREQDTMPLASPYWPTTRSV